MKKIKNINGSQAASLYREFRNDYLTIAKFAEHKGISLKDANSIIEYGSEVHEACVKPKSIAVIGKRWFDRVNGNTYCSSRVYFDGIEVLRVPWTYGYGNHYEQLARETMLRFGMLVNIKKDENFFNYLNRMNINFLSEASDGLKRDMVSWGEQWLSVKTTGGL